ncbi:RING/FYVE/PHD zinc finger superfamily protein [Klebsormidium nitens]|uniref:RING/FYVE/PHD zinc finger superfamily protein n=1 Tax=Klebsormidium nitens TaxID=105231 RepID=A0A1Y1IG06_KLENI|nr:RING/FYVE/PHD zinc finger superfamily protein [Klebsormidium nitens]|eukprot:GAQ87667.1 RING/FYVE/PHD zinc finger superfamily protein [Klebsormidium nitens]
MRKGGARSGAKVAEADGPQCNGCGSTFSLFNWKHHCRRCGKAFCDACSKDRAVLSAPEFGKEPQRVCHPCKVAERRARLDGHGKRGNRRGAAPEDSAPVVDLGLGADPLGGDQLGDSLTALDLEDPLVAATLEDAWFGGAAGAAADARKARGKPVSAGAAGRGKAAGGAASPGAVPAARGSPEGAATDAVQAEKRRALALRKAGKPDEALQALRHAHDLEAQAGTGGAKGKAAGAKKGRSMFDVNEDDMADPDLLAQLHDLGWTDDTEAKKPRKRAAPPAGGPGAETAAVPTNSAGPSPEKRAALEAEIVEHKKRALQLRKAGQLEAWRDEMGVAQALQAQLEQQQQQQAPPSAAGTPGGSEAPSGASSDEEADPDVQAALQQLGFDRQQQGGPGGVAGASQNKGPPGVAELEAQILRYKKEALACKRAGDLDGARAAMKQAKQLEAQRDEAALNDSTPASAPATPPQPRAPRSGGVRSGRTAPRGRDGDGEAEPEVTSEDEQDPEILAALREMGWQDERPPTAAGLQRPASVRRAEEGLGALVGVVEDIAAQKARLEQEVAAHKRAALAKKRAGDLEGAKAELRQAKLIERRLEEAEEAEAAGLEPLDMLMRAGHSHTTASTGPSSGARQESKPLAAIMAEAMHSDNVAEPDVDSDDENDPEILAQLAHMGWHEDAPGRDVAVAPRVAAAERLEGLAGRAGEVAARKVALQQQALALKRQALALKREGDVEGAKAALGRAKELERQLERGEEQEAAGAPGRARLQALGKRGTAEGAAAGRGPVDMAHVAQLLEGGEPEVAVTEDDEQDPEILAALQEMGWQEEPPARAAPAAPPAAPAPAQAHALEEQAQHAPAPAAAATTADLTGGHTGPPASSRRDEGGLAGPPARPSVGLPHPAAHIFSQPVRPPANVAPELTPVSAGPLPADLFSSMQEPAFGTAGRTPQAAAATTSGQGARAEATGDDSSTANDAGRRFFPESRREPLRAGAAAVSQEGTGRGPPSDSSAPAVQRDPGRAVGTSAGRPGLGSPQGGAPSDPPTPQPDRRRSDGDEAFSAPPHYWPESSPEAAPAAPSPKAESARPPATAASGGVGVSELQEQIRAGKQAAVRLKREGRLPEARAALQQAREQERQLAARGAAAEAAAAEGGSVGEDESEGPVEDAFDPDIVAALKGLGWSEQQIRGGMGAGPGSGAGKPAKVAAPRGEGGQLEDRIRSEKRRAVELKRAGRQQEALAVLREVKQLEKQLG